MVVESRSGICVHTAPLIATFQSSFLMTVASLSSYHTSQKLVVASRLRRGFSVQKGKMVDFQHDAARALDWCSSHSCIIMLKTETKDPRSLV